MSFDTSHDQCPRCKAPSAPDKNFCADCGAPLDVSANIRTLIDEQVERTLVTKFKDQRFVDLETSASIAGKLTDWAKKFMFWAGIPLGLIAILLAVLGFRTYSDFTSKVTTAEKQVENVSAAAQKTAEAAQQKASEVSAALDSIKPGIKSSQQALSELQRTAIGLKEQYGQLQLDVSRYKQVNEKIEEVQKQLTAVKGQIVDLGNRVLRVGTLETTGEGPASWSLGNLGCGPSALATGSKVAYCAEDSVPFIYLFQRTSTGDLRPVSSVSPIGFQDASNTPKPTCTTANRGTFYVEKGTGVVPDKPFLCAKKAGNTYDWVQLSMIP